VATVSPTKASATPLTGRRAEREELDRLLTAIRSGESRSLVLRGEPGVGKTRLLEYLIERASDCRIERAAGVQSEMELAFAGLHQLLVPMLTRIDYLPPPQRDALRIAFGDLAGTPPDHFLVALAVLGLLSEVAEERPLLCLVDDEQWLDRASAQVLAVVARRLEAESVGLVFAAREASDELGGLPELVIEGLRDDDARALLEAVCTWPVDPRVRDRMISETGGNPLALLEFARTSTPADAAGGFALPSAAPLSRDIEEAFRRRLRELPAPTRRLLLVAAADPVGEPTLVWRAAGSLGIDSEAATPAVEDGLVEFGPRVRFYHPLVRSAAYRSAAAEERQRVHRALAEATDPATDPDRRAWHLAHSASGPDEAVAVELVRSADRAHARGGFAAAAAFLERAATLTPEPERRIERLLAAVRAKRDAGALDDALELLVAVEAGPVDELRVAEVERLRGQIALEQQRGGDAAPLLLDAARRFDRLDAELARETHLESLVAATWAGDGGGMHAAVAAARAAPLGARASRPADAIVEALATRAADGFAAAAPLLGQALEFLLGPNGESGQSDWQGLAGARLGNVIALELWDAEAWHLIVKRMEAGARRTGALARLRLALNFVAISRLLGGDLATASFLTEQDRRLAGATGNRPLAYTKMFVAAWRGREPEATEAIDAALEEAKARGLGIFANAAGIARAVLFNGLGRHRAARDAGLPAFEQDQLGQGPAIIPELLEGAGRSGDGASVEAVVAWLSERTAARPTDWSAGLEARGRALLSGGEEADRLYQESIERLGGTPIRVESARAHLLYGEWLRRERRRIDARGHLRTAHEMFGAMGAQAFAERARRELLATGETVRKRSPETRDDLTPQEAQIAGLAREGLSNPEIGARLFISPRTVQYHLRKVFTKLGITSRYQLEAVLGELEEHRP
jgi:DNA-binding CsgD family transcriptional regulator